jgi:hypothetical protein
MTTLDTISTPWERCFERDGTEDVAVIIDADAEVLVRSRPFRRPEGDGPRSPTQDAMRLIEAAPALLRLARQVVSAKDTQASVPVDMFDAATRILARIDADDPVAEPAEPGIHDLLARRQKIAVLWSVEDVQADRPDLSDEEAWQVLQAVEANHDCNNGITWTTLRMTADHLYPEAKAD